MKTDVAIRVYFAVNDREDPTSVEIEITDLRSRTRIMTARMSAAQFRNILASSSQGRAGEIEADFKGLDKVGKYGHHETAIVKAGTDDTYDPVSGTRPGPESQGAIVLAMRGKHAAATWDTPRRNHKGDWVLTARWYTDQPD